MSEKSGFSAAHHEKLGNELQEMRNRFGQISIELEEAYPKEVSRLALKAQQAIDALRHEMEKRAKEEAPAKKETATTDQQDDGRIDDIKRQINQTKLLLSLPVDFDQLEKDGLLLRDGDKFKTTRLGELPEHVIHRIQFLEQEGGYTLLTLNLKGLE